MFGTKFLLEFKALNAVIQLFYLSRGLDVSQIIYVSVVYSFVTLLCDIPSSMLADKFGRKKLIMIGVFLTTSSIFALFFAQGFLFITLAYLINAIGTSFFSGADQAILYDSVKELGQEKSINRIAGKYFSSGSLPKIIIPFLGSLIAQNLLPYQFQILVGVDFVGAIAALIMASFLTEPKVKNSVKNTIEFFKIGFNLVLSDNILLKFALNKIIVFEAAFVYWRVYQIVLQNNNMPIIWLGAIYTFFQGIMFVTHWNTEKVQKFTGSINFTLLPPLLGFVGIILILVSSSLIILFVATVITILVGTIRDPFFLTQMQARIPSFNRATATSTLNTIKNMMDVPLLLLVGYLSSININYVLIVSGLMFAISIIFLRIKKEDLTYS
jgi:MFS family permease